jgi:hypothetical protein
MLPTVSTGALRANGQSSVTGPVEVGRQTAAAIAYAAANHTAWFWRGVYGDDTRQES